MRALTFSVKAAVLAIAATALIQSVALAQGRSITGIDVYPFKDRDVVALRTRGNVGIPYSPAVDRAEASYTFKFLHCTFESFALNRTSTDLIKNVTYSMEQGSDDALVKVTLADRRLLEDDAHRFYNLTDNVIVMEFFHAGVSAKSTPELTDLDAVQKYGQPNGFAVPGTPEPVGLDYSSVKNLTTLDMRGVPPDKVLGALKRAGLLPYEESMSLYVEGRGSIIGNRSSTAAPKVLSRLDPDFIVVVGDPSAIASVQNALSDKQALLAGEGIDVGYQVKTVKLPEGGDFNSMGYHTEYPRALTHEVEQFNEPPPKRYRFSDILITLDASGGMNLFQVLNLMSEMSGISIVIDPYIYSAPTGSRRAPIGELPSSKNGQSGGFRGAGQFNGGLDENSTGIPTVFGKFKEAPFDQVLDTILSSNNLRYLAYTDPNDPMQKPIIFVSSKERIEEEIPGASKVDFQQLNYADPTQVYQILDSLNLLPSTDAGWWVYQNPLGGNGQGGNGQGGFGGGGQGGGLGGGGRTFGAAIPLPTAKSGLVIIRGTSAAQDEYYSRLFGGEWSGAPDKAFLRIVEKSDDPATSGDRPKTTLVISLPPKA